MEETQGKKRKRARKTSLISQLRQRGKIVDEELGIVDSAAVDGLVRTGVGQRADRRAGRLKTKSRFARKKKFQSRRSKKKGLETGQTPKEKESRGR